MAVQVQASPSQIPALRRRDVLLLRIGERPNLIDLHAAAPSCRALLVVEAAHALPASTSSLTTVLIDTSNPADRPHRHALAKYREYLGALGEGQLVHDQQYMKFYA